MNGPGDDAGLDIAFVGAMAPPVNGLTNANAAAVQALARAGHRVTVHDLSPAPGNGRLRYHLSRMRAVLRALAAIVRCKDADLAYLPLDGGLGLFYNILFGLMFRAHGKALVAHHHNFTYIDRPSVLMRIFLHLAPSRQLHVLLCEDMRTAFEARYRIHRPRHYQSLVLPNAFMAPELADPRDPRPGEPGLVIGHLSNLSVEKGSDLFLDLFEALAADGVSVFARLAGPVSDLGLKSRITALQLREPERFHYVGAVFGVEKRAFFDSVDVFVFPTRYRNEAQPLVLIEALSSGCAIISLARGCIACDHARSGGLLLANPKTFVADAAAWLKDLSATPGRLEQLKATALAHANQQFRCAVEAKSEWLRVIACRPSSD
jgi:glycosyltransferase involved in cell wall biosynthesis